MEKSSRAVRIVLVTLGLTGAGAVAGAVLAVAAFAVVELLLSGVTGMRRTFEFWPETTEIGGLLGAVLGPSLAWLLLRRVPLGRAVIHCVVGGIFGVAVGVVVAANVGSAGLLWQIVTAPIGAVCAAVRLRVLSRGRESGGAKRRVAGSGDNGHTAS